MTPIPDSLDAEQISRDVARCTWHLLTGTQRSRRMQMKNKHRRKVAYLLRKKQKRLGNLINLTLLRTYEDSGTDAEKPRYYQGYHDVASIFLCTLGGGGALASSPFMEDPSSVSAIASAVGLDLPRAVLAQVSASHFRDAMQSNFLQLQTAIRLLLMPLICYFDPEVHDFLYACDMEPYFALSWIITWFSHDIRDTALVKRIFDAFIVSHPLLPIYATVAMVCHHYNRVELLNVECDFAVVHSTLANLPKNSSMVGWRYRPTGEGYESGEDTDDDGSVATMEISFSMEANPFEGRDDDDTETHSLVSSNISCISRAPFEEILENALAFMRRIPPSRLIALASRYHAEETIQPMLTMTPSIELLKPHPKWGLVSSTPADWVLKQRARQREGRKTTRKERHRARSASRSNSRTRAAPSRQAPPRGNSEEDTAKFLAKQKRNLAVIACGFGSGDEEEIRQRKRRRLLFWSSVAVALVAISMGVLMSSPSSPSAGEQQRKLEVSSSPKNTSRNFAKTLMKFSDKHTAADSVKAKMTAKTIPSLSQQPRESVPSKDVKLMKESVVKKVPLTKITPKVRSHSPLTATAPTTTKVPIKKLVSKKKETSKKVSVVSKKDKISQMESFAIVTFIHAGERMKRIAAASIRRVSKLMTVLQSRTERVVGPAITRVSKLLAFLQERIKIDLQQSN